MKDLLIPDIHLKIAKAQKVIDSNPICDRRIFLGDIYDDFGDSLEKTREAARWHKEQLKDPKNIFLWGNHDLHYAFVNNTHFACSGWEKDKQDAIGEIMTPPDWVPIKLYQYAQDWLISHAGLRHDMADQDLKWNAEQAMRHAEANLTHWMTVAGYARGGGWKLGGLTWLDWNQEFQPIPGVKQIVGHTPGKLPREKDGNWCIDTHLQHAAFLEDGKLEIFKV